VRCGCCSTPLLQGKRTRIRFGGVQQSSVPGFWDFDADVLTISACFLLTRAAHEASKPEQHGCTCVLALLFNTTAAW
jgi:hypothetical protein